MHIRLADRASPVITYVDNYYTIAQCKSWLRQLRDSVASKMHVSKLTFVPMAAAG